MKIFSSLLFLVMSCAGFFACQKESASEPTQTKTDYISASAWVHESSGLDITGDNNIDIPLSTSIPACLLDNLLTFKKDGHGNADEGTAKCNTGDPQTTNFNWSFADNETNLVISNYVFAGLNGKFKIATLTNINFSLSKDTIIQSISGKVIVNLKH